MAPDAVTSIIGMALAFASALVAITAVAVAAWQGWLMKQSLKHALYERRLRVYEAVQGFFGECVAEGEVPLERCNAISRIRFEAESLFNAEISQFIEVVTQKGLEYSNLMTLMNSARTQGQPDAQAQRAAELRMLISTMPREASRLFRPYLKLSRGS